MININEYLCNNSVLFNFGFRDEYFPYYDFSEFDFRFSDDFNLKLEYFFYY